MDANELPEFDVTLPGGSHLDSLRGRRLSVPFAPPGPAPQAVRDVEDPLLRQHAHDAWGAASRLEGAIQVWEIFFTAFSLRASIDDDTRRRVLDAFPELGDLQTVLDRTAALPREGEEVAAAEPFPAQQFMDLVAALVGGIRREARVLRARGVRSPSFLPSGPAPLESLGGAEGGVFDGAVDFTCWPPRIVLSQEANKTLLRLRGEVRAFLGLLASAPATALILPLHSSALAPQRPQSAPRLSADVKACTITFEGVIHKVRPSAAAFVAAMLRARDWQSLESLALLEDELEGVNHVSRLVKLLPPELQPYVERKPGAGCRLKPEVLPEGPVGATTPA